MADANIVGMMGTAFGGSGTFDTILYILLFLLIGAIVTILVWFIAKLMKYDKRVEILYPISNGYKVFNDRAREVKEESGNTIWRFLKLRGPKNMKMRVKPPVSIYKDIDTKGKEICRFVMMSSDSLVPVHPKVKDPDNETLKKSTVSEDDRAFMTDDIHRTQSIHPDKSMMKQLLEKGMPLITLVICIIALTILMNQWADAQSAVSSSVSQSVKEMADITEKQQDMMKELSRLEQGKETPADGGEPPG